MPGEVKTHLNSTQFGRSLFAFAIQRRARNTRQQQQKWFSLSLFWSTFASWKGASGRFEKTVTGLWSSWALFYSNI